MRIEYGHPDPLGNHHRQHHRNRMIPTLIRPAVGHSGEPSQEIRALDCGSAQIIIGELGRG